MVIAEKPVPVVYGPGGTPFAIDHHHVATALWRADIRAVPIVLVEDLSSLSQGEFWLTLENHRWTYPYDVHGGRVLFTMMPKHIWDLADDEYRSLASVLIALLGSTAWPPGLLKGSEGSIGSKAADKSPPEAASSL